MSLYNMLFGKNPNSDEILQLIGYKQEDFGRFRDVYIKDGFIVVHTRCGGGNRYDYQDMFDMMKRHPLYSHDADDDFDSTYADLFFKLPEGEDVNELCNADGDMKPSEKWQVLFNNIDKIKKS